MNCVGCMYMLVCVLKEKGAEIQATLADMTGQKTVPSVFIGGQHVGESHVTRLLSLRVSLSSELINTVSTV